MNGILVLIRHGESEWNAKGVWTGLSDIGLSEKGKEEAKKASQILQDISFDHAFVSPLLRAQETFQNMNISVQITTDAALNERDYGIFTGKNKFEIQKQLGDEEFLKLRRGWDYPIPNGESLKQVYERVVPYYVSTIEPLLKLGKKILIVAHGNSLRALMKYLEKISDEDISKVELATGEIVVYNVNASGSVISKQKRIL